MEKKGNAKKEDFFSDLARDDDLQQIKLLYTKLKQKYNLAGSQLFQHIEQHDILIPVTIFNHELSGLEAICKYLRENLHLSNKEIAKSLNRSEKTVWQAYQSSRKKYPSPYALSPTPYTISVQALQTRNLSVLETIVTHLKESFNLTYHAIAQVLVRDDRTIWTVYHRALKKIHG